MSNKTVSERIKSAREAAGLSLRAAAEAMDIAPSTLLHWERGTFSPRIADVPALCETLGCGGRWLVFGSEKRTRAA